MMPHGWRRAGDDGRRRVLQSDGPHVLIAVHARADHVERALMLVTALSPVIGYDKASGIADYAMDNDLTLKEAA